MQPATTVERPLEPADLSLLRDLRAGLKGAIAILSIFSAVVASALVFVVAGMFSLGGDSRVAVLFFFSLALILVVGFALNFWARNIRLFFGAGAVLRHPERIVKQVSHGELGGIAREDGVLQYTLGGEAFPVWIPIRHANNGNLEFIKSAGRLDGLMYQPVVLERLSLAGAPAPLLLRADYPGYRPLLVERASTEDECRDVARFDFAGLLLGMLMALFALLLVIMSIVFGPLAGAVVLPMAIAAFVWMKRKMRRWAQIQPRTLTVTGVVVEVLDSAVAAGRSSELQRWYRIGDRLYPTGLMTREDDPITCGSVVKMDYVDRSPRGGRILRMVSLADG